jgi:hypothetical protein
VRIGSETFAVLRHPWWRIALLRHGLWATSASMVLLASYV